VAQDTVYEQANYGVFMHGSAQSGDGDAVAAGNALNIHYCCCNIRSFFTGVLQAASFQI
jgi:hypothetical protein